VGTNVEASTLLASRASCTAVASGRVVTGVSVTTRVGLRFIRSFRDALA
jgi:hypothetical protein